MKLKGFFLKFLGYLLYVLGAILVFGCFSQAGKIIGRNPLDNRLLTILLFALGVALGVGLIWLGHRVLIYGKRVLAKKNSVQYLENGMEELGDFVLYLRSFSADEVTRVTPDMFEYNGIPFPSFNSEEENIERAVRDIGPLIAIAKPNANLPDLGATRLPTFEDDQWQEAIKQLMAKAKLILLRLGNTDFLLWEARLALQQNYANKLAFLIPKGVKAYNAFVADAEQYSSLNFPKYQYAEQKIILPVSLNAIMYFSNSETPVFLPFADPKYRARSSKPLFPLLRIALRPVFANVNQAWTPPPIPYKIYLWLAFFIYWAGLCIGWLIALWLEDFFFMDYSDSMSKYFLGMMALVLGVPLVMSLMGLFYWGKRLQGARRQFR